MYLVFRCESQKKTYIHASHHTDLVSSSDHRPALMSRPHSLVLTAPFFIPLLQPPHLSSVSSSSSPSSSSPARGTLGFSASGLLSNSRSTQYKAFFFSSRDQFWLFCFVNSNESQNKHAFNPVINILTENISRLASDAFCVSIYLFHLFFSCGLISTEAVTAGGFIFCFSGVDPLEWIFPFFFSAFGPPPMWRIFLMFSIVFSILGKHTIPVTRMTFTTRLCNSKKGLNVETK